MGLRANDDTRLRYRYLDLRRPTSRNLKLHARVTHSIRNYLDELEFIDDGDAIPFEINARRGRVTYLVPSHVNEGHFLRSSSKVHRLPKAAFDECWFDRYYQIVKCFRDEDLRGDEPEFTQVDLETSFLAEQEIQDITEGDCARDERNQRHRSNASIPSYRSMMTRCLSMVLINLILVLTCCFRT